MRDLEDAQEFVEREWPGSLDRFERRLTEIERVLLEHPRIGYELTNRSGVRALPCRVVRSISVQILLPHPGRAYRNAPHPP
jgi:hypothetical protein